MDLRQNNWVDIVVGAVVALAPVVAELFESPPGTPAHHKAWATLHASVIKDAMEGKTREEMAKKYKPLLPFEKESTKNKWIEDVIMNPPTLEALIEQNYYWFNENSVKADEPQYEFKELVSQLNVKPTKEAAAKTGVSTLPAAFQLESMGTMGIIVVVLAFSLVGYLLFFKK